MVKIISYIPVAILFLLIGNCWGYIEGRLEHDANKIECRNIEALIDGLK